MPTLADIYSAIDSAKRRAGDFLSNPGTSLEQMLGYANDRARIYNQALDLSAQGTLARAAGQQPTPEQEAATQSVMDTLASGYSPIGMTVIPFGKARNVTVPAGQDYVAVNPVETRARQALDDLVNQAKYFGVDSPIDHTQMPIGNALNYLDDYFGRSQQVSQLSDAAKESLRNLWYKAENAANAYKRVYGENKLMGQTEEAANKDAFNKRPAWIPEELQNAYENKQISQRDYERQVMKNFKQFFKK